MIASMGSGKTYTYLKLMKQQECLFDDAFYELIVICSTSSKFDETVNAFKDLIKKSKVVCIKDTDLLAFLNKYMRRILKFNSLIKYMRYDSTKPKDVEKMLNYITSKLDKYKWRTFPHRMLLVLDDFASHPLLRSKENELPRLLKKLRHFNINVICCVQTTRSIPRDLKRILSDIIIFPGISEDDFYDLFKEAPLGCFNMKECYNVYKSLTNKHDRMAFHINANRIIVTNCENSLFDSCKCTRFESEVHRGAVIFCVRCLL